MHRTTLTLALLPGAATAFAGPAEDAEADLERAEGFLALAQDQMGIAAKIEDDARRVRLLQFAKPRLRWARNRARQGLAREGSIPEDTLSALDSVEQRSTRALVDVLNAETAAYFLRDHMELARKRNAEALALMPFDPVAIWIERSMRVPPAPEKKPAPPEEYRLGGVHEDNLRARVIDQFGFVNLVRERVLARREAARQGPPPGAGSFLRAGMRGTPPRFGPDGTVTGPGRSARGAR